MKFEGSTQMKIADIIKILEDFAPLALQENYDNSGLQCGRRDAEINKVLLTLDVTESVVDEAVMLGCKLIISHHPVIFKPLKGLTGSTISERVIIKAIQHDIGIYSSHTNLDNAFGGVNFAIANKLGLTDIRILNPMVGNLRQLTVYSPLAATEKVLNALNDAGAGQIGNYKDCSFRIKGTGTFTPNEDANPAVGVSGKKEEVDEDRIEVIFPAFIESKILGAMFKAHPYEEVAYHVTELKNANQSCGSGAVGFLGQEMSQEEFLLYIKNKLSLDTIKYTSFEGKIRKVAVCGGSGSFLLNKAMAEKATAFVSSDFKYHEYFDADNKILIADIGHFESEVCTKDLFYDILTKKLPNIAILFSTINTNPIKYYH